MIIKELHMIWIYLFILSIFYLLRVGWYYAQTVKYAQESEVKFKLSPIELIGTWLTLGYFITYIISLL